MFIIHNHFSNLGTFVYFVSLLSVCNFSFICHYVVFFERQCVACAYCISASVSNLNTVVIICLHWNIVCHITRSLKFQFKMFIKSLTESWNDNHPVTPTPTSWGSITQSALIEHLDHHCCAKTKNQRFMTPNGSL